MSLPSEPGSDDGTAEPEQPVVLMRQLDGELVLAPAVDRLPPLSRTRLFAAIALAASGTFAVIGSLLPFLQDVLPHQAEDVGETVRYTGWGIQLVVNGSVTETGTGPYWGPAIVIAAALSILMAIALPWRRLGPHLGRPLAAISAGLSVGVVGMFVAELLGEMSAAGQDDAPIEPRLTLLSGTWLVCLGGVLAIVAMVLVLLIREAGDSQVDNPAEIPTDTADLDTPPLGIPIITRPAEPTGPTGPTG
ncbi:MAG TPA: hypothetical protein VHW44_24080 [Pseudonocardiaceae bacterium]|jgi:hypothetical protein|nr:hypothetical protein [Pseudonocardiaceae bacterium]